MQLKIGSKLMFAALVLAASLASADETIPTSITPETAQQKSTHDKVSKDQATLKKKLKEHASPAEIGKAKAKVQSDRTDANKADLDNEKAHAKEQPHASGTQ